MNNYLRFPSILAALFVSSLAFADALPHWEVAGNSNSVLSLSHFGEGQPSSGSFQLGTKAYYYFGTQAEFGFVVNYADFWAEGVDSASGFQFLLSPVFNFSEDPFSTYFIRGGVGITRIGSSSGQAFNTLAYLGSVGKHFPLFANVTWTPELGISGHTRAVDGASVQASNVNYTLTLFQFSVLF